MPLRDLGGSIDSWMTSSGQFTGHSVNIKLVDKEKAALRAAELIERKNRAVLLLGTSDPLIKSQSRFNNPSYQPV